MSPNRIRRADSTREGLSTNYFLSNNWRTTETVHHLKAALEIARATQKKENKKAMEMLGIKCPNNLKLTTSNSLPQQNQPPSSPPKKTIRRTKRVQSISSPVSPLVSIPDEKPLDGMDDDENILIMPNYNPSISIQFNIHKRSQSLPTSPIPNINIHHDHLDEIETKTDPFVTLPVHQNNNHDQHLLHDMNIKFNDNRSMSTVITPKENKSIVSKLRNKLSKSALLTDNLSSLISHSADIQTLFNEDMDGMDQDGMVYIKHH
eukprot:493627_1